MWRSLNLCPARWSGTAVISQKLSAEKSQRTESIIGCRSGYRPRWLDTGAGTRYLRMSKYVRAAILPPSSPGKNAGKLPGSRSIRKALYRAYPPARWKRRCSAFPNSVSLTFLQSEHKLKGSQGKVHTMNRPGSLLYSRIFRVLRIAVSSR